jgi:hypothetical protein
VALTKIASGGQTGAALDAALAVGFSCGGWNYPREVRAHCLAEGLRESPAACTAALVLSPDLAEAHAILVNVHRNFDWDWAAAGAEARQALAMLRQEHDEMERQKFLSIILQAAGRNTEADEALSALIVKFGDNEAYCVAMTYAYRGDHDLAFQWLDRAYRQKDDNLREIVGEPLFKNVADDPRYKAFLRKMNLPE